MAKKVVISPATRRGPRKLYAKQIMAFQHPDGGQGLMMIDALGVIYLRTEAGWLAYDMKEVLDVPEI